MIDYNERKRLVKLFGNRIGYALSRSQITYAILYDWYFNDCFIQKLLKLRGIGYISALCVSYALEEYLFKCL